jgi:hypothetical protein
MLSEPCLLQNSDYKFVPSSFRPRGRERKFGTNSNGAFRKALTDERQDEAQHAPDREFPRQVQRRSLEQAPLHITTCTHIQQWGSHPLSLAGRQVPASPAGGLDPANSKTKTQSNQKEQTPTRIRTVSAHGLRSLWFRNASHRKFGMPKVLRAMQNTRTSTEIWLVPVSRV